MRSWATHWVRGDPARADAFNEIGQQDAMEMLESVGFQAVSEPVVLRRDENRIFSAETAIGPVVLKVFRYGRNARPALEEEAAIVERLVDAGLPIVSALRLSDGSLVGEMNRQLFSVFPLVDAKTTRHVDLAEVDFETLGVAIARIHLLASKDPLEHRLHYTPETWGRASLDFLLQSGVVHSGVRDQFEQTERRFLDKAERAWPTHDLVPIHTDLDASNFLWSDTADPLIVDFEELGLGPPIHDVYRLPYSLAARSYCDEATASSIRQQLETGYRSVAPLPTNADEISGFIEGIRGMSNDCFFTSRRHDRHYGGARLTAHTRAHWTSRVERLERYL